MEKDYTFVESANFADAIKDNEDMQWTKGWHINATPLFDADVDPSGYEKNELDVVGAITELTLFMLDPLYQDSSYLPNIANAFP